VGRPGLGALVVVALLGACAVLVADVRPAAACSCAAGGDPAAVDRADVVFTGTWVDTVGAGGLATGTSTDPVRLLFDVERVHRGEAYERQSVVTAADPGSCGLALDGPGPFLVFARSSAGAADPEPVEGELVADLCGGTRPLAAAPLPAGLDAEGVAPLAGSSPTGGTRSETPILALAMGAVFGATAVLLARRLRQLRRSDRGRPPEPPDDAG
jgi:hypothetical protein